MTRRRYTLAGWRSRRRLSADQLYRTLTSGEGNPPDPAADLRRVFPVPVVTVDTEPGTETRLLKHNNQKGSESKGRGLAETFSGVFCGGNVHRDTGRRSCRAAGRRAAAPASQ